MDKHKENMDDFDEEIKIDYEMNDRYAQFKGLQFRNNEFHFGWEGCCTIDEDCGLLYDGTLITADGNRTTACGHCTWNDKELCSDCGGEVTGNLDGQCDSCAWSSNI